MFKRFLRYQPLLCGHGLPASFMGKHRFQARALGAGAIIFIICNGTAFAADMAYSTSPERTALSRMAQRDEGAMNPGQYFSPVVSRQETLKQDPLDDDDSDDDNDSEPLTDNKPKPPPVPAAPGQKSTEDEMRDKTPAEKKSVEKNLQDQAPKSVPTIAEQRKNILDALFQRLAAAKTRRQADDVLGAIEEVWSHSGSDTADLLMKRVILAYSQDNYSLAGQLLNKLALISPNWSEVWARSAVLRATEKDDVGAMRDIERALALEPRHIDMLVAAGNIFETTGDSKNALKMYSRAHDLYPQHEKLVELIEKLKLQVGGRGI